MSRTKKGTARDPYDFYSTPEWCVHRLLEKINLPSNGYWLEPTAGDGSILKAIMSYGGDDKKYNNPDCNKIFAVEIQEQFEEKLLKITNNVFIEDFEKWNIKEKTEGGTAADVCIGNPPYNKALSIIQHSLEQSNIVCMLLRINFLASEKRAQWMASNTPDIYVLPNRPKFKYNNSDACEYAWFVWDSNNSSSSGKITMLNTTPRNLR